MSPSRRDVKEGAAKQLSTTSFAILGLLALRPYSGYELAQQVDRSLQHFWPRTKRQLFEQPKLLVQAGYATAAPGSVGRRRRTVYSITPAGRGALRDWMAQPGRGPCLEWEGLIKVFFAEHLTNEQLLAHLRGIRDLAASALTEDIESVTGSIARGFPFPDRLHLALLVAKFFLDYTVMVERWAEWALTEVERWESPRKPDDLDRLIHEIYGESAPTRSAPSPTVDCPQRFPTEA
jgi:DNA-binding PadR family transcriptional regulator